LKKKGGIDNELTKWLEIAERVGVPPENLKVAKDEVATLISLMKNKYPYFPIVFHLSAN
jgi:hypothetical protein